MHTFTLALASVAGMLVQSSLAGGPGFEFNECGGSAGLNTADALALLNDTILNDFNPPSANPFSLTASNSFEFGRGGAQFCIENDFLFSNTHIFLHDLAEGAFQVLDQCCQNTLTCEGGSSTVFGDSGLSTIVRLKNTNEECQGSIQDGGILESLGEIGLDVLQAFFDAAVDLLAATA